MNHNLHDLGLVTILIADDNTVNRRVVSSAFAGYNVLEAVDGEAALELLHEHSEIDVILMDVMMPGLNGFETCQIIKEHPRWRFIPVIMLTSLNDVESRVEALQVGADDFISKPFSIVELRARVNTSARAKRYYDQLENTENILVTLANVVEGKDSYTNGHLQRIEKMTRLFCEKLDLTEQEKQIICYGGLLHDIGKVAVSDLILLKPDKLTPEEFETIKTHTIAGFNIVSSLKTGKQVGPIVRGHHERWNGEGYPDGLYGTEIPLGARIIGICDVFDALTTDRPYREKIPVQEALQFIQSQAGIHFDPDLVKIFIELSQEF
jgi:putative two-component system response regulator